MLSETECKEIGANIRYYRMLAGFSQEDLAQSLNVSQVMIHKYESGQQSPTLERSLQISHLLNISLDILTNNKLSSLPKEGCYILQFNISPKNTDDPEKTLQRVQDFFEKVIGLCRMIFSFLDYTVTGRIVFSTTERTDSPGAETSDHPETDQSETEQSDPSSVDITAEE